MQSRPDYCLGEGIPDEILNISDAGVYIPPTGARFFGKFPYYSL